MSTPTLPRLAPYMESDSISKRAHRDSPRWKRPVSVAAGSPEDLGQSRLKGGVARRQLHRELGVERGHSRNRDLTHGHMTGEECSPTLKRSGSVDTGTSGECPHPKE